MSIAEIEALEQELIALKKRIVEAKHALATSWSVSTDGLIWEFKLRTDAVWVRYVPSTDKIETKRAVNAQDVVYSVRRVFDPRVGSGFHPLVQRGHTACGQRGADDHRQ